mmetsp:Transcript_7647/g.12174  ORF Transcript_7647/g.12174 Transcript_7647/m.12174 type:complete len:109 (+) Transcript_7647:1731-2057(+)
MNNMLRTRSTTRTTLLPPLLPLQHREPSHHLPAMTPKEHQLVCSSRQHLLTPPPLIRTQQPEEQQQSPQQQHLVDILRFKEGVGQLTGGGPMQSTRNSNDNAAVMVGE